jgi:hypothetical protein
MDKSYKRRGERMKGGEGEEKESKRMGNRG